MSGSNSIDPVSSFPPVFPGDAVAGVDVSGASAVVREEAKRHEWWVLAILSALMGFASISTDVYLPAMPAMRESLHAAHGMMEWTISGYLIGFSIGQLFWGVISDRYGRRIPVAVGIILFIVGSAGCAVSDSAAGIIGWRIVQALGACASVVLSRAMVRDLYKGDRAAQMMSTLIIVMAIAPLLGPVIGGQILIHAGWRMIFWGLAVFGAAVLAALFFLPETLALDRRNREPIGRAFARYGSLLKDRTLLSYAGAGGFFYGSVFAYIAGTPFAYITYYHVPAQYYGLLFGAGIAGIMAMNFLNARLVRRMGLQHLLLLGSGIAAVAGLVLAVNARTDFGGLAGLAIPIFIFVSMNGLIAANSMAGALENFPDRAGAVSALIGAIQYGTGIISSALVGGLADGTPWPMGAVIGVTGVATFLCVLPLLRKKNV